MEMTKKKLHVALLSSPGLGHLIPVLVLGNRLATHHDVKVTVLVIGTSSSPAESQILKQSIEGGNHLDVVQIPPMNISHLIDSNTKTVTRQFIMVRAALPGVRSAIAAMKHLPDVLIVDLFCTSSFPIATEFGMPKYLYIPTNAWYTSFAVYCQVLDKQVIGQYVDQIEPFIIPGCKSMRPEDVVDPMLDRNDPQYEEYLNQVIGFTQSDGILMNTWEAAESISLKALRDDPVLKEIVNSPVYPIGPLTRQPEPDRLNHELKDWLDMQPMDSVLFVSFGSGGSLSSYQLTELAWGLELSQQRFLWVVRPPAKARSDEAFFNSGSGPDVTTDFLPEGFMNRTKNTGLVVPLWAEQIEILNHPSVGGFLSHSGWNSILESIKNGVPMIVWPLYAEQRLNATMLTEELGIAVRSKVLPTKKVVEREEISEMVKRLMEYEEGKGMRERVKQLKISGELATNNGGSSVNSMSEFLKDAEIKMLRYRNARPDIRSVASRKS